MSDHDPKPKGDILVVDDRADNLRLLSTMLTDQGYKVRKVIKSELAFDAAQVNPPDLILLDIAMPIIDGFEVCQQLKADPRTQSIPIIFLSASDEPLDKVKAFSVGGEDYITKPFEVQEVLARIEHQLKLVRLQRQLWVQNQQLQGEVAERLKAEAALRQANEALEARVQTRTAELTQANQNLQQLGQQLQQALIHEQELSGLKSRIITAISHEYRTPMAIISSSTGVLEEYFDKLNSELRLKHLNRIQEAIQRMTYLVDDVLFLNQLEFETLDLSLNLIDLRIYIKDVVTDLRHRNLGSQHIQVDIDGQWAQQVTDSRLLIKILTNLLANAIKFSPQSPNIYLKVGGTADRFFVQIQDTGIGIPEDALDHVCESFYRASNTDNIPGVGLGLTIVQKCVEILGGTLEIDSHIGLGATVTVWLPRRSHPRRGIAVACSDLP